MKKLSLLLFFSLSSCVRMSGKAVVIPNSASNPTNPSAPTPKPITLTMGGPYVTDPNVAVLFTVSVKGGTGHFVFQWDFGDGGNSTLQNPNHAYSKTGTYHVTATVTDDEKNTASAVTSVSVLPPPPSTVNIFPTLVANARKKAAANTMQWQSFKKRLDTYLNQVLVELYEGSVTEWAIDYALGYKVLEEIDPPSAQIYADKAIAIMKMGMRDIVAGYGATRLLLARGDGTTTSFTIPNKDYNPSTLKVYVPPVTVDSIVRGKTPNTPDFLYRDNDPGKTDDELHILKISNTSDGNPDYLQGADWVYGGDLPSFDLGWVGKQPAAGSTYYITRTRGADSLQVTTGFSVSGTLITFQTPPTSSQAVFVEYLYGTHSPDYSTLAYQQTEEGLGGFNNIYIDDGYAYRHFGKSIALAYDWLYDYPGFTHSMKQEADNLLVKWDAYIRDNGYGNAWVNNYSMGYYSGRVMTAIALALRDPANASTILSEIENWRTNILLPTFSGPQGLQGGQWPEGWNYGPRAQESILLTASAINDSGIGPWKEEVEYSKEVVYAAIEEETTQWMPAGSPIPSTINNVSTMIQYGNYNYPEPWPGYTHLFPIAGYLLLNFNGDPNAENYATWMAQNEYQPDSNTNTHDTRTVNYVDGIDLLIRDPAASAPPPGTPPWVNTAPISSYLPGQLMLLSRVDYSFQTTFMWADLGAAAGFGHVGFSPGQLDVYRGRDQLLLHGEEPIGEAGFSANQSTYANIVLCDDGGAGYQSSRWQTDWPAGPGNGIPRPQGADAVDLTSSYVYGSTLDITDLYSYGTNATANHTQRRVLHILPDTIVVHDFIQMNTPPAGYKFTCQLQWHTQGTVQLGSTNNFTITKSTTTQVPDLSTGNLDTTTTTSQLFAQIFSSQPIGTTENVIFQSTGNPLYEANQLVTNLTSPTSAPFTYVSVLQTTPSSGSAPSTQYLASSDQRFDGSVIGNLIALFPQGSDLSPWSGSSSYTLNATGTVHHYITGVEANRSFTVTVNSGTPTAIISSAGGVLSFTTSSAGALTVTLQ